MSEATIFRSSTLARCLIESLDEMITEGRLDEALYEQIMEAFDGSIIHSLTQHASTRAIIRGNKESHNCCEGVWLLDTTKFKFSTKEGDVLTADKLQIVAIDAKVIDAAARLSEQR